MEQAQPVAKRHWSIWLARGTLLTGLGAVLLALTGAYGSGEGWWTFVEGFGMLTLALIVAFVSVVLGVITLFYYRRNGNRVVIVNLIGLALAAGYIGVIGYYIGVARAVPMIHDISTNTVAPPEFVKLELRADNWKDIPGRGKAEYAGMDAKERWKLLHDKAYGDIQPLSIAAAPDVVLAKAKAIAEEHGWQVALYDPAAGRIEATETVSLFKFKDDAIILVSPSADGKGSIVNMRSVSRVGVSDLGVNAKRVRHFLKDLAAAFA